MLKVYNVRDVYTVLHTFFSKEAAEQFMLTCLADYERGSDVWYQSFHTPSLTEVDCPKGYWVHHCTSQWVRLHTCGIGVGIGEEYNGCYTTATSPCFTTPELVDSAKKALAEYNQEIIKNTRKPAIWE